MAIKTDTTWVLALLCSATISLTASGTYGISETEEIHLSPLDAMRGESRVHHKRKDTATQTIQKKKPLRIERKIPRKITYKVDHNGDKVIYLTFDDGPVPGTANVLRVLREEGVEATMFFVGKHIVKNRPLYHQAASMSNLLIANHTYSHANEKYARFYSHTSSLIDDIDHAQAIIGGAKYLRLAGRNVWRLPQVHRDDYALSTRRRLIERPKYDALESRGYQIYGWDIEWNFNHATGRPTYGAERMVGRIENSYNRHSMRKRDKIVLLAHDYMFRGRSGIHKLRMLIQLLKYNGWKFATIDGYSQSTPAVFAKESDKKSHHDTHGASQTSILVILARDSK